MASPLFKFASIQAKELQPNQFFDIAGDGKAAIFPVKVYRAVMTGKVLIVSMDYQLHILDENQPLFVLRKRSQNAKSDSIPS